MKIYDRQLKKTIEEKDYNTLPVKLLYNNILGRTIVKTILVKKTISKLNGKRYSSKRSVRIIPKFIKKHQINMEDYPVVEYKSFNDFFKRIKKEEYINIDTNPDSFISPCDCKLSVYKASENTFKIKGVSYDLELLLKSKFLAQDYKDGYVVVCRLTPDNYHRYCYIDNGYHDANKKIKGNLNTVRPIATTKKDVFITNARSYTVLDTSNFGQVIQIEVGALMVGKIKNNYTNHSFKKGEEKGFFEYGGSTIILLVKNDKVKIDNYLLNNTKNGYETIVSIGDKIGVKR